MNKGLATYFPGVLLFIISLTVGLSVYKDYGMSWDEQLQRNLGTITYNYVVNGDQSIKTYQDKAYGTGFELPLILIEKSLKLTDPRDVYMCRHITTHIFFLLSALCAYVLALHLFKDQFIACLGFVMLVFCPRIYAHSFFNSKDIPFLSACVICLLLFQLAFEKKRAAWYLMLGLTCGYATSIRAMGIFFLPGIVIFFLDDFIRAKSLKEKLVPIAFPMAFFLSGYCGMLYAAWPFLWEAPIHNFITSFRSVANISPGKVLFRGSYYDCRQLPWNYMPVWFSITVPPLWLAAGALGFAWIITGFIKKPAAYLRSAANKNYLLYAAYFLGPAIAMVIFNGANIDDWRHLYFIYPPFVMLALFAVHKLATGRARPIIKTASVLQIIFIAYFMISNHPFQQVYFNTLVSHKKEYLRDHYELDYWGSGFKQGLERLAATNESDSIKIYWSIPPLPNNILMLPARDRKRTFMIDSRETADYLITNFRGNRKVSYPGLKPEYSITVLNSTIMCIYRLH